MRWVEVELIRIVHQINFFFTGVIARHPSYVPFIRAALTEESVEKYFKHLFPSLPEAGRCRVKR